MNKIRLNPDHLRVESFATATESRNRGTVAAHQQTYQGCEFTLEVDCTHVGICDSAYDCKDNAPQSLPLPC
jgi:hypothetical protein